jgi:hypothetical protein
MAARWCLQVAIEKRRSRDVIVSCSCARSSPSSDGTWKVKNELCKRFFANLSTV